MRGGRGCCTVRGLLRGERGCCAADGAAAAGKLHFFSEIFLDSENFLRKSQIFRPHFLRKSTSYLRKCNLVFFSLGARFRITNYASENYF